MDNESRWVRRDGVEGEVGGGGGGGGCNLNFLNKKFWYKAILTLSCLSTIKA